MSELPIAIDGPAASGKSTVGRLLAERLQGLYISSGELYRALTLVALRHNIDPAANPGAVTELLPGLDLRFALADSAGVQVQLNGQPVAQTELRKHRVAERVSYVARIPEVRSWLIERQRETCRLGRVVVEGRDIGSVVFPDTPYKFFITASARERARRRLAQVGEIPEGATLESVTSSIVERDKIDRQRAVAPLKPADDAEVIVTDALSAEEVAEHIAQRVQS